LHALVWLLDEDALLEDLLDVPELPLLLEVIWAGHSHV